MARLISKVAVVAAACAVLLAIWMNRPLPALDPAGPAVPTPPGGPIVVLGDRAATDGLDSYLGEMLRTEGWTAFSALDVSRLSRDVLAGARLVIVSWDTHVDVMAASTLEDFVRRGGALVCLGPRQELRAATGVGEVPGTWRFVDLPVFDESGDARATAQVFGTTAGLIPDTDVEVVAHFLAAPEGQPGPVAVATRRHGAGRVATFGFDPARSVAYLRQGDPAWRGEERDGAPGPRATDAFVGWTNLALAERPQADDHLRLLSSVMDSLLSAGGGVPRLWYFPTAAPALLVVTGDAHATSAAAIETGLDLVEQAGGRMSVFYDPPVASGRVRRVARRTWRGVRAWWRAPDMSASPAPALVATWRARGHDIGPHPVVRADDVAAGYRRALEAFRDEGLDAPLTAVRTHATVWRGWVDSAAIEQAFGVGLTLDYYQYGPWLKRRSGEWLHEPFTGSGLPMRLVDEHGALLGIRQLTTTMADEQLIASAYGGWEGLDADGALAVSNQVLTRAVATHGMPILQFHLDFMEPGHPLQPTLATWVGQTLARARAGGIPIWSASQVLAFERCREQTRVVGSDWSEAGHLRFSTAQPVGEACGITIDVPLAADAALTQVVGVSVDGTAVPSGVVHLGRRQLLPLAPGSHTVDLQLGRDSTLPRE